MSFLEISVGFAVVSMLVAGIAMKYSGRADDARFATNLEEHFAGRKVCETDAPGTGSEAEEKASGWQRACFVKKSGIATVKYILPSDQSEKQRVLTALRRLGGRYNGSSEVTFERAFLSRHSTRHRAFRYLLNEGFAR